MVYNWPRKLDHELNHDYDCNGNMTMRNKKQTWYQRMRWDSHNPLAQVSGVVVNGRYFYDESGRRIRKTAGGVNTDYPFLGYEQTRSVVTKHYSFNGVAVAVRSGTGAPSLLYGDGVQSTIYTTDLSGEVTSSRGYYAFGSLRKSTGTIPTDRRFTGQQEDATGIYYYGARYYDPQLGQFLSPDTIVPDPNSFLSYNRYLSGYGNPVKYNDPSGHDPLDATWEQEFSSTHRCSPTDQDRRDRLYSLMVMGHGVGGTWTDNDWQSYSLKPERRDEYWNDTTLMEPGLEPSIGRFAIHVNRLASYYTQDEKALFVKALAFVYASYPMGNVVLSTADMLDPRDNYKQYPPLLEGMGGWDSAFVQKNQDGGLEDQAHHYAAFVYMGFWYGIEAGMFVNGVRDGICNCGPLQWNPQDIALGNVAVMHGDALLNDYLQVRDFSRVMFLQLREGGYD